MVEDKTNKLYTELMEYMRGIYPNVKGGTTYSEGKTKLPYVYFFILDNPTRSITLSNDEAVTNLVYQIEVYTESGGNQTRKMATDIRSFMIANGFNCRTFMRIQSSSNISRFVARYERLDV